MRYFLSRTWFLCDNEFRHIVVRSSVTIKRVGSADLRSVTVRRLVLGEPGAVSEVHDEICTGAFYVNGQVTGSVV